jgi:hypothetical protein
MRTAGLVVSIGLCCCVASRPVAASAVVDQGGAPITVADEQLDDAQVTKRIEGIQAALDAGTARASVWYWGFAGVQLGSGVVNLGLALNHRGRPGILENRALGAVQGFLGFVGLLINPMVPSRAAAALRVLPADSPAARRDKLAAAESLLRRSAERERAGRAWYNHVVVIAAGAASGLLLAFAFEDTSWVDGLINMGIVVGFGELQIWAMPTRAIKDWERYQRSGELPVAARRKVTPALGISAAPGGFAACLVF